MKSFLLRCVFIFAMLQRSVRQTAASPDTGECPKLEIKKKNTEMEKQTCDDAAGWPAESTLHTYPGGKVALLSVTVQNFKNGVIFSAALAETGQRYRGIVQSRAGVLE